MKACTRANGLEYCKSVGLPAKRSRARGAKGLDGRVALEGGERVAERKEEHGEVDESERIK